MKKSDKIEKNNFSQNLDHYYFGPPANRTPLTISYKNQWKIEKNRVQGKKPCTFFRYLQSHFSRNSPLSLTDTGVLLVQYFRKYVRFKISIHKYYAQQTVNAT